MQHTTIAQLIAHAAELWEVPENLIVSDASVPTNERKKSSQWVFQPRAAVALAAYEDLKYSYPKIGFYLNRHHTTIINSVNKARILTVYNPAWAVKYKLLTA